MLRRAWRFWVTFLLWLVCLVVLAALVTPRAEWCDPCVSDVATPPGLTWEYPGLVDEGIDVFVVYHRPKGGGLWDWEEDLVPLYRFGRRGNLLRVKGLRDLGQQPYVPVDWGFEANEVYEWGVTAIDVGRPESGMSNVVEWCAPTMCEHPFFCTDPCGD